MITINGKYQSVTLVEPDCQAVFVVVRQWVSNEKGSTEEEQRYRLPKLENYYKYCVSYVMDNLPEGVERVDGNCIKPLLKVVIQDEIANLPVVEPEPELEV